MEHLVTLASKKEKRLSLLMLVCLISAFGYKYVPVAFEKFVYVWFIVAVIIVFVHKALPFFERKISTAVAVFFGAVILIGAIFLAGLYTLYPSTVTYCLATWWFRRPGFDTWVFFIDFFVFLLYFVARYLILFSMNATDTFSSNSDQKLFFDLTYSLALVCFVLAIYIGDNKATDMRLIELFVSSFSCWIPSFLLFLCINKDRRTFRQTVHFSFVVGILLGVILFWILQEGDTVQQFFVYSMGLPILIVMYFFVFDDV